MELTMKRSVLVMSIIICLFSYSCSSTPPSPVYTPQIENTTAIATNSASTPKSTDLYWSTLLDISNTLINEVLPFSDINHSDKESMTFFRDKLIEKGVAAGLVKIDSRLGASGNLDYCVAVNTLDRGIVFLYILPNGIEIANEDYRLQAVYLINNERIGLLPVKYITSIDYSWYENYLEKLYYNWDYGEYLNEFENTVEKNKKELDDLSTRIDELIDFASNPRISIHDSVMSQGEIDVKYNSLRDKVDALVTQYNDYSDKYNQQLDNYNSKLDSYTLESDNYPNELFYVEEYTINPNSVPLPFIAIPTLIPLTITPITPLMLYTIDGYLNALQNKITQDYSYNMIPEPLENGFKSDRITDKNFVVDGYKIYW